MAELIEFDSTDWITAGAIGEPGARSFYVQAEGGGRTVAFAVEKGQVAGLADLSQELLSRFEVAVVPDDLDENHHRLRDGIEPLWRVGELGIGASSDGERFALELHELVLAEEDEIVVPSTARFWMTRHQLVRLAAYAAYVVEAGARERCPLCNRPMNPGEGPGNGHVCPATNGHGTLTQ